LAVWHGVDFDFVSRYSPLVATKLAASTSDGLDAIAKQIVERIYLPADGDVSDPGLARQMAAVLSTAITADEVAAFLADQPSLIPRIFDLGRQDSVRAAARLGNEVVDYAVGRYLPTMRRLGDWRLLLLGSPADPILHNSVPTPGLARLIERAEAVRSWISRNPEAAGQVLPNISPTFTASIIIGRRPQPDANAGAALAALNDELVGSTIRTYDWLLDRTFEIDAAAVDDNDR
jgi:hypothetical protein